ncbi:lipoate-protein ligase A [Cladorrhinum sp. PSN332]|nr:lipoate-protein ligase A [Cladorrhinum sp. PSN332]
MGSLTKPTSKKLRIAMRPSLLLRPGLGWRSPVPIRTIRNRRYISDEALSRPIQIYRSMSDDPYLNLSIEHHLLKCSNTDSTILFIYFNKPSVVIGRNQNPWKEINLLRQLRGIPIKSPTDENENAVQPIHLVRRRSGGGTVFHDEGNANWCVICPPRDFDRDKHAEMVVRALKGIGCEGVRVNERHDIVQDVDIKGPTSTFKVSGSAYKLTRTRSLHHGTCLLESMNASYISKLLNSAAEPFIKAAGVDSVKSPVRNLRKSDRQFRHAVIEEFKKMYKSEDVAVKLVYEQDAKAVESIMKGYEELKSPEWFYGQTPQFTISWKPTADDPRERPANALTNLISDDLANILDIKLTVRHGAITEAFIWGMDWANDVKDPKQAVKDAFLGLPLYQLDFLPKLAKLCKENSESYRRLVQATDWLHGVFGTKPSPLREKFLLSQKDKNGE